MSYHWIKIYENEDELNGNTPFNTFITLNLKGEKICLTRTRNGVFAVQEKCPHNGASLARGFCTPENIIVCPLHRYQFDLKTGQGKVGGYALTTYPIQIKPNGVFIGIKAKWWEF
ncbi:MAG: Rieske 2Fe-2S domain-containing protein [Bacteroidetes bacterium]|nr:Rieske 2Fe-2S domain-containing protein [Bacteroidota bacterium]